VTRLFLAMSMDSRVAGGRWSVHHPSHKKIAVTKVNNAYVTIRCVALRAFESSLFLFVFLSMELCFAKMADRATAVYWAQRKDADDDSTLLGSRIVSVRSMEYSSLEGGSMSGDSSLASSVFQGDLYFTKEPDTPPYAPPDWNFIANENSNEKRGREFAKKLLQKSTKRRKKTIGLFQRALIFPFRHNRKTRANDDGEMEQSITSSSVGEYSQDDSFVYEEGNCKLGPPLIGNLDEISDCISDVSSYQGVEVWQGTSDEESWDVFDTLKRKGETPKSRRFRDADLYYPEGLFVRTSTDEMIDKLHLGSTGRSAIRRLDEATAAALRAFDPSQCGPVNVVPKLVTVAGYAVPDYSTYVRQAVTHFRKNVLQISDDLYELLEKRMAKSVTVSKLRLLPFAVELYCLEKLMMNQIPGEEASV
jgi:hypothetical protein